MSFVKSFLKQLLFYFLVLIILSVVVLANLFLTGRTERAYNVVGPETVFAFMGQEIKSNKLAQQYQPIIEKRSGDASPDLLWTYFEIVNNFPAATYDLIYYPVWEKEINPKYVTGVLFSLFRMAYYGFPPLDINYFQVNVGKDSGKILQLLFETNQEYGFTSVLDEDVIASYQLSGEHNYTLTKATLSGKIISQEIDQTIELNKTRPVIGVVRWSHSYILINSMNDTFDQSLSSELRYMAKRDYAILKIARKNQAVYKTRETTVDRIFLALVSVIFIYTAVNSLQGVFFGKKPHNSLE
jgi:hypothetical protein